MNRIFGLDILRSFAVLFVVLFHSIDFLHDAPWFYLRIAEKGWAGVDLFFVLSGFLIGTQLFEGGTSGSFFDRCRVFWIKRWTRTLPMYFLILFLYVAVKPILFNAPFNGGFNWTWLVFLQNFFPIRDFGQSWSLCVEEQFYLLFPVVGFAFFRAPALVWLLPFLFSVVYCWVRAEDIVATVGSLRMSPFDFNANFRMITFASLDSISIGTFLARTRLTWTQWTFRTRLVIALATGLPLVYAFGFMPSFPTTMFGVVFLFSFLAIGFGGLTIFFYGIKDEIRGLAPLKYIAMWSYSAYLWHQILTRFIDRYFGASHWLLSTSFYLGITFLLSWLTYSWVEVPGLNLRKRFLRPSQSGR